MHAIAEGAAEGREGVGEINDEGEASAGDQDTAGFAAEAAEIRIAGGPGGDGEGGGTGGAGGEKIQHIGDVPLNGRCAGARAGLGDHTGGEVAGENGTPGMAGGELKRGNAGAAAEIQEIARGQGAGKGIEQAAGGVL